MPDRPTNAPDHDPAGDAVGRLVHEAALTVQAPPALRTRLAEQERRAARPRRRWGLPAALAGAGLAAVAVVALLVGGGGDPAAPSVAQAAALALARPTDPPPATDPADTTRVRAAVDDVAFPNYAYIWPKWHTAGVRRDRVGGRATVTVTYRGPAGDVGYTIVDGKPLPEPANARHVRAGGLRLAVVRRGGATVVTWRRGGHTCVLASRGRGVEPQLIRFATWA